MCVFIIAVAHNGLLTFDFDLFFTILYAEFHYSAECETVLKCFLCLFVPSQSGYK